MIDRDNGLEARRARTSRRFIGGSGLAAVGFVLCFTGYTMSPEGGASVEHRIEDGAAVTRIQEKDPNDQITPLELGLEIGGGVIMLGGLTLMVVGGIQASRIYAEEAAPRTGA